MVPFRRSADLAIDLGTSTTRVWRRTDGHILESPTVVATRRGVRGREVIAVGTEAKKMLGRTPEGTDVIRPVRNGVVSDFEATEHLLRALLKEIGGRTLLRPRLLVCVPSNHTETERRAVQESARAAGGRDVLLVSGPMAAAIGADLPIDKSVGSLIVDIGGGRTDVAVVSLGGIVVSRSIPVAGEAMDAAIVAWLEAHHRLLIGDRTAEGIKQRAGSALPINPPLTTRIRGRDLTEGTPREVDLTSNDVALALGDAVSEIRDTVISVLGSTSPELSADILARGLILCGGGARLRGLDSVLREATGLPVIEADDSLRCAIRGAGRLVEDSTLLDRVTIPS